MAKTSKATTRHGHRVTKTGAVKVTTTRKPKGIAGKLMDAALKVAGK